MLEEATNAHVEPDTHSHAVHSLAIHRVPCPYTSCYTRHHRVGVSLQPTVACSDTKTAWLTSRQAASRELVCRDVVPITRVAVTCPHFRPRQPGRVLPSRLNHNRARPSSADYHLCLLRCLASGWCKRRYRQTSQASKCRRASTCNLLQRPVP